MHTKTIRTKTCGRVVVHYNADWSGTVIVGWDDPRTGDRNVVTLPIALVHIVHEAHYADVRAQAKRALATPCKPGEVSAPASAFSDSADAGQSSDLLPAVLPESRRR